MVSAGFLGFVSGGAEAGAALCAHESVDAVHITGSEQSFRAVAGPEAVRRKVLTAELGSVTPVMVVPGRWSSRQVRFQAGQLAGILAVNGGFNCNTPKVLVTAKGWRHRQQFLDELRAAFAAMPARKDWYPGSAERWSRFIREYGGEVPPRRADELPLTLLPDVPAEAGQLALTEEAFCPVLAECAIDADDELDFLERVVPFANETIAGSLSCMLLAAPSTDRAALEKAIDRLNFGTVAVNTWSALAFAFGTTPWGAFPGHTIDAPGSGIGVVHNTPLFDHAIKSVLRARFTPPRKTIWTPGFKHLRRLGRDLVAFEHDPSLWKLLKLVPSAYFS